MADFLTNLWSSVFTPGPTPTLLLATNATFATLQLLLLVLLVATYSIHFVILSLLCGGLWASINWFARELVAAQAQAEQQEKAKGGSSAGRTAGGEGEGRAGVTDGDDDEDETGTETEVEGGRRVRRSLRVKQRTPEVRSTGTEEGMIRARGSVRDLSGEVSTDSEWEKVEGDR